MLKPDFSEAKNILKKKKILKPYTRVPPPLKSTYKKIVVETKRGR